MESHMKKAYISRVKRDYLYKPNAADIIKRLARIVSTKRNIDIKEIQFFEQDGNNFRENKISIRFLGV